MKGLHANNLTIIYYNLTGTMPSKEEITAYRKVYYKKSATITNALRFGRITPELEAYFKAKMITIHPKELDESFYINKVAIFLANNELEEAQGGIQTPLNN